jgi:SagB-type dehydrogenase family enzyme
MPSPLIERHREFLKDTIRQKVDFSQTDQSRGVAPPPLEKPFAAGATRIKLIAPAEWQGIGPVGLLPAIQNRRSRRDFTDKSLSLDELSLLVWATQGIRQRLNETTALRTVPSAGARHALETYLCVFHVQGLEAAVYRYLPMEHELLLEFHEPLARVRLNEATFGQSFVGQAAVTFIWTAVPYRMEWRYGPAAHKLIALDAGHVCQNLYLACEAIGAGTCAVAAYHQQAMDRLVRVDGSDEFVVYLAPVGK